MDKEGVLNVKLERLKVQIDELREILNEVCAASGGVDSAREVLFLSQSLDELIVQYMDCIKNG